MMKEGVQTVGAMGLGTSNKAAAYACASPRKGAAARVAAWRRAAASTKGRRRTPTASAARVRTMAGAAVKARGPVVRADAEAGSATRAGKKYVVITGASSGLGLRAARDMANSGDYHVVMACRDFSKAEVEAQNMGMQKGTYTVMHLDLGSLESVRTFVDNYRRKGWPIDCLVCNAAVYLPTNPKPSFTAEGFECSVGTNHLGHFLLCNLLMDDIAKSSDPRVVIVGSVTGNTNTLAGQIPPKADLGDLRGLEAGLKSPVTMIDGGEYDGAKAYKDSKVCNMLTMREMHRRFHDKTGIVFSSLYPGCVAETNLFREKRQWFRWLFPRFQKYVTKGYVSMDEAGERLAQVASDPKCTQSGVYWSWNGEAKSFGEGSAGGSGGLIFENNPSDEVLNDDKASKLWDISVNAVGLS